jgi:hypothetical protein
VGEFIHGEPYTISIEPGKGHASGALVESFCVFFRPGVLEAAAFIDGAPEAQSLDRPDGQREDLFLTYVPHAHDDRVSPILRAFHAGYEAHRDDALWLESAFHRLMNAVVSVGRDEAEERSRIQAARPATRRELYRRLWLARDYLLERHEEPVAHPGRQGGGLVAQPPHPPLP